MRVFRASISTAAVLWLLSIALLPTLARADDLKYEPVVPKIQIDIPTLKFSDNVVKRVGGVATEVSLPWIGDYLAAIYRFAVPAGAILATIIIMVAGVIWLTSGASNRLSTAQEWIQNAVIGLLLLVGSYVILNLINPDLVRFQALRVRLVQPDPITDESEPESVAGSAPTDLTRTTGDNIIGKRVVSASLLPSIRAAASALEGQEIQLLITSGFRDEQIQRDLIAANCQNPPGSATCNRKPGRPITCMLRDGPKSCPHTTGRAIDAWGAKDKRQCISQKECLGDKAAACRADPCQAAVIAAMRAQGFCNFTIEPWHFEKPPMSPNCT